MANIFLPERFKQKLYDNQELNGIVNITLSNFGEILIDNKPYFFPEYTDHGIQHIEKLILSADNLITEETFNDVLTSNDIGYFVLSVILHDIGMHLSLDGFEVLIDGKLDGIRIKELDTNTWAEMWHDFLNEAKKFSGKQLKGIFGDENTIIKNPNLSNRGSIDENDKKLIGEFIRRHHPRLAHEIALNGFPGKPEFIEFAKGLDEKIKNMIGLIARSHGLGLRKCLNYIELAYGKNIRKTPNSAHAVYLMVLLRIADYIQINAKRTSKTVLKTKTLSSPISDIEHQAHLAIDDVDDRYQDDPERIYVTASPRDSKMFLKLRKLIKDIQYEFDISWAVLGELYGTLKEKPSIKYRRITSNLEEDSFGQKQKYIADTFSFKANDEIIKLLIGPLYGNNPTYGVRELLQNAIDACKERQEIELKKKSPSYIPFIKIEVLKEENSHFFVITDNGVGMDIQVIKEYFLSAGASYRKNIDWQKQFIDDSGNVLVRKSGRFGIGILAAFLIGKEILVESKNSNNKNGHRFVADLFTEQINVLKDEKISNGTTIKIKISKDIFEELEPSVFSRHSTIEWFKWFTLENPRIEYYYDDEKIEPYPKLNPDSDSKLPFEWNSIDSTGFNKILWTYSKDFVQCNSTCNGIIIPTHSRQVLDLGLINYSPQISIFDNNATTPLTLSRNSFSSELPFSKELKEDIYKDFIAFLLTINLTGPSSTTFFLQNQKINYPGTMNNYENYSYGNHSYDIQNRFNSLNSFVNTLLISKKGFIVNYNYFLQKLKKINVELIQSEDLDLYNASINLDIKNWFIYYTSSRLNSINDYKVALNGSGPMILDGELNEEEEVFEINTMPINSRIFMKSERYKFLFNSNKKRMPEWLKQTCKLQYEKYGFSCLHLDTPPKELISAEFLKKYSKQINFIREYVIHSINLGDKILDNLLQKYIGNDVIIPFDLKKRQRKYPLAFKDLGRYLEKYIPKSVHSVFTDIEEK